MQDKYSSTGLAGEAAGLASQVKSTFEDAKSTIKDKASEMGNEAANAVDSGRTSAANSLQSAASSLHDHASSLPGGQKVEAIANDAADKIGATADYLRTHGRQAMMADLHSFVKTHPGQSLVAAAVVGFLAARAFQSRD